LARRSANYTQFYAETHPSQPNYLALFSGSTQGVTDNNCPHDLGARPNLARQLLDAGHTFTGYSEGLPAPGWRGCSHGRYVRRHASTTSPQPEQSLGFFLVTSPTSSTR
jgi:phosphatidylinositol-3-phosphatase